MMRHAVDYELHLSVLLKGVRGIGKFTVATWVAQRLGMHLLEVNIFLYREFSPKIHRNSDKLLRCHLRKRRQD